MPPPSGYTTPSGWSPRSSLPPNRTPNPYLASGGGRTPGQGISGRTPNPYQTAGGRTPGWAPTAPTPNPYASGGRTPGWNSGVTPNPYLGGRTPARTDGGQSWGADQWGASSPAYRSPAWVIYVHLIFLYVSLIRFSSYRHRHQFQPLHLELPGPHMRRHPISVPRLQGIVGALLQLRSRRPLRQHIQPRLPAPQWLDMTAAQGMTEVCETVLWQIDRLVSLPFFR
jgi:hypothetical protein